MSDGEARLPLLDKAFLSMSGMKVWGGFAEHSEMPAEAAAQSAVQLRGVCS